MANRYAGHGYGGGAAGVILALCLVPVAGAAEFHRWVDSEGNVHYTDAPPPDSAKARPSAEEDAARTREREAKAEAAAAEQAAAEEKAAADRRDEVLLQSYTTVEEIERTRERRLDGVEGEIGLAKHRIERARTRVEHYDNLLAKLPEDNDHREEMKRQRREAAERLERRRGELERLRDKRADMEARFEGDIERFRELKADNAAE